MAGTFRILAQVPVVNAKEFSICETTLEISPLAIWDSREVEANIYDWNHRGIACVRSP